MSDRDDYIVELQMQIHEYADDDAEHGWLIVHHAGRNWRFPKRALMWYVFGSMKPMYDLLPEYEAFSPSGLKLQMDNRYHTDVMIGAGFGIDGTYDHGSDQNEALHMAERQIEDEMKDLRHFDFTVLANGQTRKYFRCQVFEHEPKDNPNSYTNYHIDDQDPPKDRFDSLRAICIPTASVEYDLAARNADVIITEVGGELAHLAIVSREKGKVLIRVTDACKRFPKWSELRIDLDEMTLECV